jgi:hypothetical protein
MSVSSISSSSLIDSGNQNIQTNLRKFQQEFQQEFQQLGSDLQTGTLSTAQQDFSALPQFAAQGNLTSPSTSPGTSPSPRSSPIAQTFNQLGQAVQSGSASGPQQDNTQLQTNFQKAEHTHGHHHHPARDPLETSEGNDQSGQGLQPGDVSSSSSSVPAAYNSALQDFQHFGQGTAASLTPDLSALSSNSISVSA